MQFNIEVVIPRRLAMGRMPVAVGRERPHARTRRAIERPASLLKWKARPCPGGREPKHGNFGRENFLRSNIPASMSAFGHGVIVSLPYSRVDIPASLLCREL
jgi:hypothetical protein